MIICYDKSPNTRFSTTKHFSTSHMINLSGFPGRNYGLSEKVCLVCLLSYLYAATLYIEIESELVKRDKIDISRSLKAPVKKKT